VALGTTCQNANMDGRVSIFYNIAAAALAANGKKAIYSSAGSSIWVSAPGGGGEANASTAGPDLPSYRYDAAMVTTDRTGCVNGYARTGATSSAFNAGGSQNLICDYTSSFNGTSSAAPATVGSIALLLDARPDLTWRDVKHILAMTARRVDPAIPAVVATLSDGPYTAELPWTRSAAGRWFHNWYGFGAVDVDAAVSYARTYTANSLGTFTDTGWTASATPLGLAIPDDSTVGATSTLNVSRALTIEAIQIEVTITHPRPGDLGIELTSPSGTKSILLNIRNGFAAAPGLQMTLVSNLFYGEPSAGGWTVKVVDGRASDVGTLDQWEIRVLGH
jgi:subtilisin-like proprotein convertase family protein